MLSVKFNVETLQPFSFQIFQGRTLFGEIEYKQCRKQPALTFSQLLLRAEGSLL